jgi:hypothetical protein
MRKAFHIVVTLFLLLPAISFSQNWQNVGQGFSFQTRRLSVDTVANLLYCTGGYSHVETLAVNGCAQWNNSGWDSVPHANPCGSGLIVRFNGDLYYDCSSYLLRWNGIEVDTVGNFYPGGLSAIYLTNNALYALGGFDSINGMFADDIAKFDGATWSAIDTTHWLGGVMNNAIFYQNNLYVSGNFISQDGSMENLAMWDGTLWNPVGNNLLANGLGGCSCFAIYNNDLWIGGFFFNTYSGIARWNGTQWLDPGGGTNYPGQVEAMQVFNNELWVGGNFSTMAGLSEQYVSKWNGTDWCGMGDTLNGTIGDMKIYNNELYISGGFAMINSDTMNYIAKWAGGNFSSNCGNTTGIHEHIPNEITISVFPNPVKDFATVQAKNVNGGNIHIKVIDILGQTVIDRQEEDVSDNFEKQIDVSGLNSGVYMLIISTGERVFSQKIIVQH